MNTNITLYDEIKALSREFNYEEYRIYAAMLIQKRHLPYSSIEDILDRMYCYILWEFHDSSNDEFNIMEMKKDLFDQLYPEVEPLDEESKDFLKEVYHKFDIELAESEIDQALNELGVYNVEFFDYHLPEDGSWHTYRYVCYTDSYLN